MIKGHGDDSYQYEHIKIDFSSNICAHADHQFLMNHLMIRPELISHYPEPEAWSLERLIAEREGIDPACVIVTGGATEAIYLVAQTFRYLPHIPQPTFSEYADACRMYPQTAKSKLSIWLCNPNNPTGSMLPQERIDDALFYANLVVIDQSYEHYTEQPVMSAFEAVKKKKVIQLHSMTKTYGVPGLRLGYIVAAKRIAAQLRRHLHPWSVSSMAIEAGKFLLNHDELICRPDLAEAQRLSNLLNGIEGISVVPTHTNFMLCKTDKGTAANLKEFLAHEHRMLIRDASNFEELTHQHFRIAAQMPEANDALVAAIREFVNNNKD